MLATATSLGLVGTLLWLPMKRLLVHASPGRHALGCGALFLSAAVGAFGAAILVLFTCAKFG